MMTEQEIINQLNELIQIRSLSTMELNRSYIKTKLLELRDALFQWAHLIEEKEGVIVLGERSIIFDVVGTVLGNRPNSELIDAEFFQKNVLPLSQYDKILIYSYFNWKMHEAQLREKGYDLPCPYNAYIDLLKAGSQFLSYSHNWLEVSNVGIDATLPKDHSNENRLNQQN